MRRITFYLLIFPALGIPMAHGQNARAVHAKSDSFLSGPPFTLDQVLRVIGQDAIPIKRRREAIQNRGVDFAMTPEAVARLKAVGATDDVIELIQTKARPLPPSPLPPPPNPPPTGNIRISCAPVDCDVAVNGVRRAATSNGSVDLAGLTPGSYTIDLSREGYVSKQELIKVEVDKVVPMSATLAPTRETREKLGAELYGKMMSALGGEASFALLSALQATGNTTTFISDGRTIRWSMRLRTRTNHALVQVKTGSIEHEVLFTGNDIATSKSLKGQDALELPVAFGMIRDNQFAAFMARLDPKQYKFVTSDGDSARAEFSFTAEGATNKIFVDLDSESRPLRVKIVTETGMGSLAINYSDYILVGQAWYPKSMLIKAEGQQHGVEVHFDRVELDTTSKDTDFRLKNKLFANFYN